MEENQPVIALTDTKPEPHKFDGAVAFECVTIRIMIRMQEEHRVALTRLTSLLTKPETPDDEPLFASWLGAITDLHLNANLECAIHFVVSEEEATRPLRDLLIGISNGLESIGLPGRNSGKWDVS